MFIPAASCGSLEHTASGQLHLGECFVKLAAQGTPLNGSRGQAGALHSSPGAPADNDSLSWSSNAGAESTCSVETSVHSSQMMRFT